MKMDDELFNRAVKAMRSLPLSKGPPQKTMDAINARIAEFKAARQAEKLSKQTRIRYRINALKLPGLAAAVIVAAIGLLLITFTGQSVALAEVYGAVAAKENVKIENFLAGKIEPLQTIWISRTLNIKLLKSKQQLVLFDLNNNTRTVKDLRVGTTEVIPLTGELLVKLEKSIILLPAIMPFPKISEVPGGAVWKPAEDIEEDSLMPGTEAYELTWRIEGQGEYKWQIFIDKKTLLPEKVKWYKKDSSEQQYILENIRPITYPTDEEISFAVKELFD